MISPVVVTSKPASKDFERIKANHSEILQGMAIQSDKVAQYHQQKAAELANQNAIKAEVDKQKMISNTEAQKNALDFASKQAEIDIKRAALAKS